MTSQQHTTRISAGAYRYRVIKQPGEKTRPVTQKIRAAIFDTIGHNLAGLDVADLYAGSGALGIEALSRGARSALFIEKRPLAAKLIEANGRELGLKLRVEILDVVSWLKQQDQSFDIIFFDPPYAQFEATIAEQAAQQLSPEGVMIISCGKREELPDNLGVASMAKLRIYGQTKIAYYKRSA